MPCHCTGNAQVARNVQITEKRKSMQGNFHSFPFVSSCAFSKAAYLVCTCQTRNRCLFASRFPWTPVLGRWFWIDPNCRLMQEMCGYQISCPFSSWTHIHFGLPWRRFLSPPPSSLLLGRSLVGTVFALQSRSPAWHSGHTLRTRAYSTAEVDGRPPVSPW